MSSRFGSVPGGGPGCGGLGVTRRSWPLLCCALREVSAPSLTLGLLPRLLRLLPVTDAKGTIARQERTSAKQTHRLVHRTNRCGKRRARFIVRKPLSEAANRLTEPASCLLRELVEGQPLLSRTLLATLPAMAARLNPVNKKIKHFLRASFERRWDNRERTLGGLSAAYSRSSGEELHSPIGAFGSLDGL